MITALVTLPLASRSGAPQRVIVQLQFRQRFAGLEMEIVSDVIALFSNVSAHGAPL